MLVVQLLREMLAERVEHCSRCGLAHQGQLRYVVETVTPAQYLESRQNLQSVRHAA